MRDRRAYIGVVKLTVLLFAASVCTRVRAFDKNRPRWILDMYAWIYEHLQRPCAATRSGLGLYQNSAPSITTFFVTAIMQQWPVNSVLIVGAESMRGGDSGLFGLNPVRPCVDAFINHSVRSHISCERRGDKFTIL